MASLGSQKFLQIPIAGKNSQTGRLVLNHDMRLILPQKPAIFNVHE